MTRPTAHPQPPSSGPRSPEEAIDGDRLLDVRDVTVEYLTRGLRRSRFTALHGVSIDVRPGETVGLVGESGSGKSTLGRAVLGLVPVRSGSIVFDGADITTASRRQRRELASSLQVVFQDPYNSLNPGMEVGRILAEPLSVSRLSPAQARQRVHEALELVHLPADAAERRPNEFSGGQRQRIAIARALVMEPRLIVCDEPLSALDLATQSHIIDLFIELQERLGTAYLFVSHDLHVVRHLCHRVSVMRAGRIVEHGPGDLITSTPAQQYTRELLEASPVPDPRIQKARARARTESVGRS